MVKPTRRTSPSPNGSKFGGSGTIAMVTARVARSSRAKKAPDATAATESEATRPKRFRAAQRKTPFAPTTSRGKPTRRATDLEGNRTTSWAPRNSLASCSNAIPAITRTPRMRRRLGSALSNARSTTGLYAGPWRRSLRATSSDGAWATVPGARRRWTVSGRIRRVAWCSRPSNPAARSNPQKRVATATSRLLQEDEHMTIKSKLMILFSAGMLASTVAAHAQGAMAPDPNIAPSTSGEEAELPGTTANSPMLAAARIRTSPRPPAARRRSSRARSRTAPSSRLPRTRTWDRPPLTRRRKSSLAFSTRVSPPQATRRKRSSSRSCLPPAVLLFGTAGVRSRPQARYPASYSFRLRQGDGAPGGSRTPGPRLRRCPLPRRRQARHPTPYGEKGKGGEGSAPRPREHAADDAAHARPGRRAARRLPRDGLPPGRPRRAPRNTRGQRAPHRERGPGRVHSALSGSGQ